MLTLVYRPAMCLVGNLTPLKLPGVLEVQHSLNLKSKHYNE